MDTAINTILITQARYGSSRLPGKVLLPVGDQSLLSIHLQRLLGAGSIRSYILATTKDPEAELIAAIGNQCGFNTFKGNEEDVLDRFYQAALPYAPDYVVRVTSDCPFNEAALVDEIVDVIQQKQFDYCSTGAEYPDGVDVEVFTFDLLRKAWQDATLQSDREHVTPFIKRAAQQSGKFFMVACPFSLSHVRMTVDEKKDFDAISHLSAVLGTSRDWLSYANYIDQHPGEFANQQIVRNEGYLKSIKHDEKNN